MCSAYIYLIDLIDVKFNVIFSLPNSDLQKIQMVEADPDWNDNNSDSEDADWGDDWGDD